ncbi:hypothetical protein H257_00804 [Aphanomyces astaci]|uniref:Copper transport protein n=1 Tax=Aphanomyces astaci TaxID=112090 RepID=W4HCF2_APHAT|nr:hypothetical protein H257_00804 [Aphanomyces astaci]ETV89582.1 hypothetical protein H257_00804 [Aphanomyces astaci]|eukprot:XP_009821982.1 hypothetical protein H257_00804 [Aphanomyces astaci]
MFKFVVAIVGLIETASAHDHGAMNAATALPGGSKHCPICNMDVVSDWYIQMAHGQRIYSCSMIDGSQFKSGVRGFSHASLVGATMKDISSNPSCDNSCPDCAAGTVLDPMSGDVVSDLNFKYLCLNRGQKVYFASEATKQQFVQGSSTTPYFGVDKVVCGGSPCPDSFQIPPGVQAPWAEPAPPFCTGSSVMFSGFQTSAGGTCVKLFFQSWVLDTPIKYFFGLLGVFLLPLVNEYLVVFREDTRMHYIKTKVSSRYQGAWTKPGRKLVLTLLYMGQMTLAYLAMLVVMVYDSFLFLALIAGFGVAFACFKSDRSLGLKSTAMMRATWRFDESDFLTVLSVEGMMCMQNCGSTVQSALEQVDGVKHVYVGFSEKCAYVSGSAPTEALVAAVEAIGFDARVLRRPRAESNGATAYGSNSHLA